MFGIVDILRWQVRESGADNWAQTIEPAGVQRSAQLIDAPFDWNTGIRIGIGRNFDLNSYYATLTYTHFQTQATNQASGIVYSSFVGNYFVNNTDGANFGPTYQSANIRWQFFYDSVDLDLGKNIYVNSILQLQPFIGLKAASINQNIYTHWLNPTTPTNFTAATENLKNNFSGIGPMIGVNTAWRIYKGTQNSLSLIGNIATGILPGHWKINEIYSNNTPITVTTTTASVNGASPVVDGFLGLEWCSQFAKSEINIRLGYEEQIWFNQLQFYSLNLGRINRPVSLQGGNLEFRFNF